MQHLKEKNLQPQLKGRTLHITNPNGGSHSSDRGLVGEEAVFTQEMSIVLVATLAIISVGVYLFKEYIRGGKCLSRDAEIHVLKITVFPICYKLSIWCHFSKQ